MTLLVNFGGPRNLEEVSPFLQELLTDPDVIRPRLPLFVHRWFFRRVARKRASTTRHDYAEIGGKSPIFFDTEKMKAALSEKLSGPVLTFHRYLPSTHTSSLQAIEELSVPQIKVIPLFPQFCYSTTGSIARFFSHHLSFQTLRKLRWVKSYAAHPAFILSYQKIIASFLEKNRLAEKDLILLFSAHGIPKSDSDSGDIYESECNLSFRSLVKAFPNALHRLSYQSKFGRAEWLRPYTNEVCEQILDWNEGRKEVVVVPITFTSDHIETLFEIENLYLPLIRAKGLNAYRCPALNLEPHWIDSLVEIAQETNLCTNEMLVRTPQKTRKKK